MLQQKNLLFKFDFPESEQIFQKPYVHMTIKQYIQYDAVKSNILLKSKFSVYNEKQKSF